MIFNRLSEALEDDLGLPLAVLSALHAVFLSLSSFLKMPVENLSYIDHFESYTAIFKDHMYL